MLLVDSVREICAYCYLRDVLRHEQDGVMADALKPLTGMTPDQYRGYKQRFKLSPQDRNECARLYYELPGLEQRAANAPTADRAAADVDLYKARKRFNDLNCRAVRNGCGNLCSGFN